MKETINIRTGELKHLKLGFLKKLRVMYSGMPTAQTFTLSPLIKEGYNGFATNIYYSIDARSIFIQNYRFNVIKVTRDEIILKMIL